MGPEIVVGVDGSTGAAIALRWAVEEAALRGTRATAVFASMPDPSDPELFTGALLHDHQAADAHRELAALAQAALGSDETVDLDVVDAAPTRTLLQRSEHADLVVVGPRGAGLDWLLVSSVADRLAQRAIGPVAIVRAQAPIGGGRVVVGIDGSARSVTALRWAAAEAQTRDAVLGVVHSWTPPAERSPRRVDLTAREEAARSASDLLADALRDPSLAGVKATAHLHSGPAAAALLDSANGAGLLVVARRGPGTLGGWRRGSVTRQLVHHAPCPVVVI